ncbi:MAG: transglycosylase domain-containing protein [Clostridiales bacterium]|nr:transglycosylase domain-containing protein [Clostridiales bacterium]
MANDYDDLLESFMNNSAKVYSEDKKNLEKGTNDKPSAYSESDNSGKKVKRTRNKKNEKIIRGKNKSPRRKSKAPAPLALRILLGIILVGVVVSVVCISVIAIYGYTVVHGDPVFNLTEEKYSQNQTSFIYGYDSSGNEVELTRLHGEENRIWVNLDDMSEYIKDAFIAVEDQRFMKHHGVDWIRTIGVIVKRSNGGQGGSTITQQLIKNLTEEDEVTIVRKFNEILSALNLERNYDKNEIIEAYLNTIFLSEGCYGVKTAAEKYFGKDIADLNIAECACIAAITQFPSRYNPLRHPEANRTRQLYILEQIYKQGFITEEQYNEAVDYKMVFTNSADYEGSQVADSNASSNENVLDSYYVDYVVKTVIDDLQKMGYTKKKANALLYGGGLKIYTAIDFDVQNALEDVYENYKRMPDETVQGAMVVMNYEGRILGLVGGTGKYEGELNLNRAFQSERQPGSVIKPLSVYGPAFEKSLQDDSVDIYWSTLMPDRPLKKVDGKMWPTNEGGSYSGNNVTIQYGLSKSLNTVSAQTLDKIGVDYSFDFISNRFHISTLDNIKDCDYAPMATGSLTNGVTVLDMTAAYATFGNGGQYYYPYCYYKIEDSQGNVLIETDAESTKEQALSESTGWLMNKLLQTVMTSGTGTSYKISGVECFGKTGTTTASKDRWFVGGTPEYVAAVWYGYDTPKEIVYRLSPNPSGTIWKTVMNEIYDAKGINQSAFAEYDGIVQKSYDTSNGLLANYSSGATGWYDKNNLPAYSSRSGYTRRSSSGNSSSSETTKSSVDDAEN